MKKILTKEEREKWNRVLTKYFQQANETGRCKLAPGLFKAMDDWYMEYLKSEKMKKQIVEEML